MSGDKGLWINDIKKKAGKLASKVNVIIKSLEKKSFIKSVKTIKAKNRKVWMAMSVEPSVEVTGGILADDVYDSGLMDLINQKCVDYIKAQGKWDFAQVEAFVRTLPQTQKELSENDIFRIIETQIYDGKIEAFEDGKNKCYKVCNWYTPRLIYTEIPCSFWTLFAQWEDSKIVNPKDWKYYTEWF